MNEIKKCGNNYMVGNETLDESVTRVAREKGKQINKVPKPEARVGESKPEQKRVRLWDVVGMGSNTFINEDEIKRRIAEEKEELSPAEQANRMNERKIKGRQ